MAAGPLKGHGGCSHQAQPGNRPASECGRKVAAVFRTIRRRSGHRPRYAGGHRAQNAHRHARGQAGSSSASWRRITASVWALHRNKQVELDPTTQAVQAAVAPLAQEVQQMRQGWQQSAQSQQQTRETQAQQSIEAFRDAKGEDGTPSNPYFEDACGTGRNGTPGETRSD